MRVLMVSHLYPSRVDSVYGSFVHSQVKALQAQACQVRVLAPVATAPFPLYLLKEKWRRFHATPKRDDYQGVRVEYPRIIRTPGAALFSLAGWNYYLAMKSRVRRWHQDQPFHLIHAQVAYPDGWAAARLARATELPLVLTLHGQELQKIVHWSAKLKELVQSALGQAAAVVVPSDKMRELALANGVDSCRLKVVHNGLDALPLSPLPPGIEERLAGKRVLLSVGRLEKEKGCQHNIRALAMLKEKHPDLVYLLAGEGAYRGELAALSRSLGLADRVIFAGHQPRENIGAFYAKSHVFSLPSRDEAFGIVYLEAMAAGLPVIATRGEGIAALVEESGAGLLVSQGDVEALAGAISLLLEPLRASGTGEKGRRAARRFTWERSAGKLLSVYKEVLK